MNSGKNNLASNQTSEKNDKDKSLNTNTQENKDSSENEKNKEIEVSPSLQLTKKLTKNNDTTSAKTANKDSQQYCSCVRPSRKNTAIEYRIKGISYQFKLFFVWFVFLYIFINLF